MSSSRPTGRLRRFLAVAGLLLLLAACNVSSATTPTAGSAPGATETTPVAATQPATARPGEGTEVELPSDSAGFPLDLQVPAADNIEGLAPFRTLTADGLPASLADAELSFVPYEYKLAALLDDGQLLSWNVATGALTAVADVGPTKPEPGAPVALAMSSGYDGSFATALAGPVDPSDPTANAIRLWGPNPDRSTSLPSDAVVTLGDLLGSQQPVRALAYSPDGSLLAVGQGSEVATGSLAVWQVGERVLEHELDFDAPVRAVQFAGEGPLLIVASGNQLVFIEPDSFTELRRQDFDFTVEGFQMSPTARTTAVWGDQVAELISDARQGPLQISASQRFNEVEILPDERLALLADGDLLRVWDIRRGAQIATFRSPAPILDLASYENGRVIATIDDQARLLLWGVRGGFEMPEQTRVIAAGNRYSLERVAQLYLPGGFNTEFSPNSDWLAIDSQDGIYLVDLPSLQLRRLLESSSLFSTQFDVSADGQRLAWVAAPGTVKIWDLGADALAQQLTDLSENCCGQLLLTPEGDALVLLDGLAASLWDLASGQQLYQREDVQQVHMSPDGSRLAFESARDLQVDIWDRSSGRDLEHLTGFTTAAPIYTTSFSPDWQTMYWVARVGMQFQDVATGQMEGYAPFSWGIWSPNENLVASVEAGWTYDSVGQVHLVDPVSGDTQLVFDHHEDAIVDTAAFSPDGRLLVTATENSTKMWDARTGEELFSSLRPTEPVNRLTFSPDGRLLLSSSSGGLFELFAAAGAQSAVSSAIGPDNAASISELDRQELGQPATSLAFSPDASMLAAGTGGGRIWYWDLTGCRNWPCGNLTAGSTQHTDWIYDLAYGPQGLASVSKDGSLRLWSDPQTSSAQANPQAGELSALAFLNDGETLVTSGQDGRLHFWSLPDLRQLLDVGGHAAWVWALAPAPTRDLLASASADNSIKLWQLQLDTLGSPQATLLRTLTGHSAAVWSVAFSPDSSTLASGAWDDTVRLWNVATGTQLAVLRGHTDWVYDVAYSPDGKLLASASADGTIRLWETATGDLLATLTGDGGRIWSVAFSPDGTLLASASDSGLVQLWGAGG